MYVDPARVLVEVEVDGDTRRQTDAVVLTRCDCRVVLVLLCVE